MSEAHQAAQSGDVTLVQQEEQDQMTLNYALLTQSYAEFLAQPAVVSVISRMSDMNEKWLNDTPILQIPRLASNVIALQTQFQNQTATPEEMERLTQHVNTQYNYFSDFLKLLSSPESRNFRIPSALRSSKVMAALSNLLDNASSLLSLAKHRRNSV